MRPSGRHCSCASLALFACLALASRTNAETLTITSSPVGASIEINGITAGTTPYKIDYPGGYFHKPRTVFSSRLDHSMTVKLSLDGYITEQVTVTQGPFEWVAINGRHHGSYFLLKSPRVDIQLDPVYHHGAAIDSSGDPSGHDGPLHPISAAAFQATDDNEIPPQTGTVTIASDPAGAEIYIDGRFFGQTPATIQLASGSHQIELKSPDKRAWSRDLEVLKGSQLTLHPVLTTSP